MESKERDEISQILYFPKTDHYFCCTEIMTTFTNFVSNLPKNFRQQFYTRIYDAISQKSMQNN